MAQLGRGILLLDLGVCLYGIAASIYGARSNRRDWVDSGRRAVYALAALSIIAFLLLEIAFVRNDFAYKVVANTSSTTIPLFYKLTAPWSSQQGSLLLWVTLSSVWSTLALYLTRRRLREIAPYATAVLLGMEGFFASLACFAANPFQTVPAASAPTDGAGLDPLLMHPSMMFHPPMLYTGYTLMAIPFAFAVGALITGTLGSEWIRDTRRFALAAWMCLGLGIILGARWSYTELGWGGYWGWDPVENAALMPWIVCTAFIHSIQIQEKRGMMKVWNVSLVLLFGTLSIFGTFLVRSGVLDSIHAFGASTLGVPFVALLTVMVVGGVGLVIWRRDLLRSEHRLDSLISREAMFLLQNLILVAITFVIFWVTLFPLISQALTGTSVSVGPPAFTPFVVPLALILVLIMGVGPLISWRRATVSNLRGQFVFPVSFGLLITILVLTLTDAGRKPLAVVMFGFGAFVIGTVAQEFFRGAAARRAITRDPWPLALLALVRRNRRRYGGYTAHLGFAVMLIGVAASSSFQHVRQASLRPGQSVSDDGYVFHYVRPTEAVSPERISFGAIINVTKNGSEVTRLHTMQSFYRTTNGQGGLVGQFFDADNADSTIGLDAGPIRDIWTVAAADTGALLPAINRDNKLFAGAYNSLVRTVEKLPVSQQQTVLNETLARTEFWQARDLAVERIAGRYLKHRYPIAFNLIVSPLVTWLWAGAIIIFCGGLISLLPPGLLARRRSPAPEHSRVAVRELA
ncbi:MAG TPA: cytochrome c-type biogenesis CcmF C-terminal domain-containing protein [Solirubrobacteraceae bacterium]|jgi:cytochrome c-type biogenesis protein CcmF|nr:cytochrome c-type biogenesis CcmF C-terminal domain-containing protein [Solirubrobacteraceae bacterium]